MRKKNTAINCIHKLKAKKSHTYANTHIHTTAHTHALTHTRTHAHAHIIIHPGSKRTLHKVIVDKSSNTCFEMNTKEVDLCFWHVTDERLHADINTHAVIP